jgi:hypothetical protein
VVPSSTRRSSVDERSERIERIERIDYLEAVAGVWIVRS